MYRSLAIVLGIAIAGCGARAEKKITAKITHPAILGESLGGKTVTPGQLTGDCVKEFADLLFQDMRAHSITVASASDKTSPDTPGIVLSIAVTRCEAHQQQPILGEGLPAVHISRTEGWFAAQLRAADSQSGQESASLTIQGHAQKENQSQTSSPEYPAPIDLKALALRQSLLEARRLYTTWTENRDIPFIDSKDCHLKQAFELAKAGDYEALLKQSRANADECGSGKAAMEAWYNLGVANFLIRKYNDAVAAFEKASSMNGAKLVDGMLDESRREAAAQLASQPKPTPPPAGAPAQTGILMTNDFVIKLIDGNVAEDEVLKMIANQPGRFSLEPEDIKKLKAAGVSDAVIAAMRNKK